MANNDSVLSRASYQEWPLDESHNNTKETTNLLDTLTKDRKMNLRCQGCEAGDAKCSCSLKAITYENTYQVFVLLQTHTTSTTTVWCPQHTAQLSKLAKGMKLNIVKNSLR